ncbi:MAG: hypothetical protein A3D40_01030 [Parcubacteria group bacterium RIFCSPHIGHO2_02_FULL_40_12]|nr:MAG: hypothetical protein A3D40_01030 [Parcubacteria group bacterium RIFCSPHIGHO2_02_FULL_40_12]
MPAVSAPGVSPQVSLGVTISPSLEGEAAVTPQAGQNLFAQIGNLITLGTDRAWIAVLVILVILGLVYRLVNYFRRKRA